MKGCHVMFRFACANMNTADCASATCAEAACACASKTHTAIILDAIILASSFIIGKIGLRHLVLIAPSQPGLA